MLLSASCALLMACSLDQDKQSYATIEEQQARVAAMYRMRAKGVQLVEMFEPQQLKPNQLRELIAELAVEADALPTHFTHPTDPANSQTTAAKPAIWTSPDEFYVMMADFQAKTLRLTRKVDATTDLDLASIWPSLKETGDTCTACHERFRVGGDPPHD